jgi:hypothetical protein
LSSSSLLLLLLVLLVPLLVQVLVLRPPQLWSAQVTCSTYRSVNEVPCISVVDTKLAGMRWSAGTARPQLHDRTPACCITCCL